MFRFKEYLEPTKPYDFSKTFFYVMVCRLVFVIAFQYFVFLVKDTLTWLVPDIPSSLRAKIARKMHVARLCFRKSAVEATRTSSSRSLRFSRPVQFDGKVFHVGKSKATHETNEERRHTPNFPQSAEFHHQSYV